MRISDWSSDVCSSDLGKTLVEEGKLITARHIKLIAEANLKQLTVPDTYLVGKVVAKDLVAEGTGEIIAAANTELTQVLLAKARESGIKILPTLFINDVDKGPYISTTLQDRKSTRLNSSHNCAPRMPYSA